MLAVSDSMEAPPVECGWRTKHCHYLKANMMIEQKSVCVSAAPYAVSGEYEHGITSIFH